MTDQKLKTNEDTVEMRPSWVYSVSTDREAGVDFMTLVDGRCIALHACGHNQHVLVDLFPNGEAARNDESRLGRLGDGPFVGCGQPRHIKSLYGDEHPGCDEITLSNGLVLVIDSEGDSAGGLRLGIYGDAEARAQCEAASIIDLTDYAVTPHVIEIVLKANGATNVTLAAASLLTDKRHYAGAWAALQGGIHSPDWDSTRTLGDVLREYVSMTKGLCTAAALMLVDEIDWDAIAMTWWNYENPTFGARASKMPAPAVVADGVVSPQARTPVVETVALDEALKAIRDLDLVRCQLCGAMVTRDDAKYHMSHAHRVSRVASEKLASEMVMPISDDDMESVFDELVHDEKSTEASALNNGGYQEQVSYLLDSGINTETLVTHVKEHFGVKDAPTDKSTT